MTVVNEYLPFATATGADVLSQINYAALAARLAGFANGIAYPDQVNKVLRQPSVVASMIGQFCANKTGLDVLDDGDVTALLTKFIAAITSVANDVALVHYAGTDTGTANAYAFPTVSPALPSGSLPPGTTILAKPAHDNTGASTVTIQGRDTIPIKRIDGTDLHSGDILATDIVILIFDGTNFVLELATITSAVSANAYVHYGEDSGSVNALVATASPAVASLSAGLFVLVKVANATTGAATLNLSSTGVVAIKNTDGSNLASGALPAGSIAILCYTGSVWQFLGTLPAFGFTAVNSNNGYVRFPNGFTIVWGKYTGSVAFQHSVTLSWPIAFTAAPFVALGNPGYLGTPSGLGSVSVEAKTKGTTTCEWYVRNHREATGTFSTGFDYIAIGW